MKKNLQFILVGVGLAVALVYLLVTSIQATGVQYVKFNELNEITQKKKPTSLKITGKVEEGSLNYDPHEPIIDFQLRGPDGNRSLRIIYEGIKPDAMQEGGHVIIEGKYHPGRDLVKAHTLLAKCPSRYKSEYQEYENKKKSSTPSS